MRRYLFASLLVPLLAVILVSGTVLAQTPSPYDTTLKKMFDAIQAKSYDRFVADGDARFKASFTSKMFDGLARQFGPKLQHGYSVTFLTTLNQQAYDVYVWKIVFNGVRDDYIITLFVKDGKISGFVVR